MQAEWKTFLRDRGAEFDAADGVVGFGDPSRERSAAVTGTVIADLSHIGVLAVRGADAETFLQGQFTNDVRHLDATHSQLNGYCSPKGRLLATFRIVRVGDEFRLYLPRVMLESVRKRLQMFVMRSAVTLEEVSEHSMRIGVSGPNAAAALAGPITPLPTAVDELTRCGELTVLRIPGVQPRYEIFGPLLGSGLSMQKLWEALAAHAAPVGSSTWELLDILAGVPTIMAETADAFVPQMVNYALIGGVSFKKGCYPGQEVVARMQYLGKLKRQMYLARLQTDHAPRPGDDLFSPDDPQQSAGKIVNAQPHPEGGYAVLAVIQIGSREGGVVRLGTADGPGLTFAELPYAFAGGESSGNA
ncbi:MAG: folate-binding protein YgfZ [Gammaproteobacteria bacterium]|nr:folate-binding protein YgfZ [Gammaproteobacteria bacterium]